MANAIKVGEDLPSFDVEIEKFPLRLFAKAIGEKSTIYTDEAAARSVGYRSIPALPTYLFSLCLPPDDPFDAFRLLNIDLARSLHGEQSFTFHKAVCAGDRVRVSRTLAESYEKKNGTLKFTVLATRLTDQDGDLLCTMRQTIVTRAPEAHR